MCSVDDGHRNAMRAAVIVMTAGLAGWAIIALAVWQLIRVLT